MTDSKSGEITMPYRVTGDFMRLVYSRHRTEEAARRSSSRLARMWGWSHPGSEPRVEQWTEDGWRVIHAEGGLTRYATGGR